MHKTHHRSHNSHFDLHGDLAKIKSALAMATHDIRGLAGQAVHDSYVNMKDKSVDAKDTVAKYVTKKPLQSVGIALLAGFVVGFLTRK